MKVPFCKMQGVGNDFVIINNLSNNYSLNRAQLQKIGDRRFGIGCDQILLVELGSDGESDFFYRIYNADGSEAGMCGNGARCFIRYVQSYGLTSKSRIQLQTVTRKVIGYNVVGNAIEIAMGKADFLTQNIPLKLEVADHYTVNLFGRDIRFAALSVGNPHAVIELESLEELNDDKKLKEIAVFLQTNTIFPQSVNVNFIVIKDGILFLRTYERGCGFTLGCGSGACASAVIAVRDKLLDSPVPISMSGGKLLVKCDDNGIFMSGEATEVFTGVIEL